MSPRTTRRRSYTPEEREALDDANRQLVARADAALADPESGLIGELVLGAMSGKVSPRILRYSLRNQALLAQQAHDRGVQLRAVNTFKGWLTEGRAVRNGETAYRIVAPAGEYYEDETAAAPAVLMPAMQGKETGRPRFQMLALFEVSQTDGIDGFDHCTPLRRVASASPTAEYTGCRAREGQPCRLHTCDMCGLADTRTPAEVLRDSLLAQLERAGYDIRHGHNQAPVTVDHAAQSVDVGAGAEQRDALALLAAAVAEASIRRGKRTVYPD